MSGERMLIDPSDTPRGFGIGQDMCDLIVLSPCHKVFLNIDSSNTELDCVSCRKKWTLLPGHPPTDTMVCVKQGETELARFVAEWTGFDTSQFEIDVEPEYYE